MDPSFPGGDKTVDDGLRQQAINDVLRHFSGRHDTAEIEAALTTALVARGLAAATPAWLEGVASEISTGNAYVVSPASQFMAAALEMPEQPEFAAALPPTPPFPSLSERRPEASTGQHHEATSDPDTAPAALGGRSPSSHVLSQRPAVTRERLIAGIMVGLAVAVGIWVRRTPRRRST
ncbi:MAG TPA: hypothetical protein VIC82_14535 [Candidatus Nanopelagicales bacterium]|jgi:hypothetical protein